jgi:C4-dicarboxylate-specific signal transduction histidine kinase
MHAPGKMTSMTDMTETNRVREQLAASHERFTTVLEALDSSISIVSVGSDEILFANTMYRQWFGCCAQGHLQMISQTKMTVTDHHDDIHDTIDAPKKPLVHKEIGNVELYWGSLGRWLEVRTCVLNWVDGYPAHMVIATDVTFRRQADELSQLQAQRAQAASRLMAMGEMASSVAHELNQPLTAIHNYCSGMVSRIKAQQVNQEELLEALEKTAKQAQRAGQIIHRICTFVKRSEPHRSVSAIPAMVAEALELADMELRRYHVRLVQFLAPGLPHLLIDPILIEQVLLNLLKNAAESIDVAQRPTDQRLITLHVVQALIDDKPFIEFKVSDNGQGIAPEVMPRLYEAFYSTKAEGMGIGLSLCRSIVESHTGRMKAENLYNEEVIVGCCFTFWLPVAGALTPS